MRVVIEKPGFNDLKELTFGCYFSSVRFCLEIQMHFLKLVFINKGSLVGRGDGEGGNKGVGFILSERSYVKLLFKSLRAFNLDISKV